jgi:hypothetical protein
MAWQGVMKSSTTITNTTVYNLSATNLSGGVKAAIYYLVTSAIGAGDTWTFTLQWVSPGANTVSVTNAEAITTNATTILVLATTPFLQANRASPIPNQLTVTRTVNGGTPSITFEVYGAFA